MTNAGEGAKQCLIMLERGSFGAYEHGVTSATCHALAKLEGGEDLAIMCDRCNDGGCLPPLIALILTAVFFWYALGYHIVWPPTEAQRFGCEHTYINKQGEDTGECG